MDSWICPQTRNRGPWTFVLFLAVDKLFPINERLILRGRDLSALGPSRARDQSLPHSWIQAKQHRAELLKGRVGIYLQLFLIRRIQSSRWILGKHQMPPPPPKKGSLGLNLLCIYSSVLGNLRHLNSTAAFTLFQSCKGGKKSLHPWEHTLPWMLFTLAPIPNFDSVFKHNIKNRINIGPGCSHLEPGQELEITTHHTPFLKPIISKPPTRCSESVKYRVILLYLVLWQLPCQSGADDTKQITGVLLFANGSGEEWVIPGQTWLGIPRKSNGQSQCFPKCGPTLMVHKMACGFATSWPLREDRGLCLLRKSKRATGTY